MAPSRFMKKKHTTIRSARRCTDAGLSPLAAAAPEWNRVSSVEHPMRPNIMEKRARYRLLYPPMGYKSLATPMKGFRAYGLIIIVIYNCCLDASIPSSLNNGNPIDHINVMTPPLKLNCTIAIHDKNLPEKMNDNCVKYALVERIG